jgi:hypothetical protein
MRLSERNKDWPLGNLTMISAVGRKGQTVKRGQGNSHQIEIILIGLDQVHDKTGQKVNALQGVNHHVLLLNMLG